MALTIEKLQAAARLVKEIERNTGAPLYPTPFNGVEVICDPNCLQDTTERNFPASKNRSKRIHKKLVKRFGSEFKKVPAMFQIQGRIIAHPVRYAELKRHFSPAPGL
jgi:hypothetical protein